MARAEKGGRLREAALAALLVFCTFAVLEAGLRIAFAAYRGVVKPRLSQSEAAQDTAAYEREGEYRGKYDHFALMRFNAFLGYVPLENHAGNGYRTNAYGLRYDEDFPRAKPEGEIRIFFTGGSTAWGVGPRQEDVYSARLERLLRQSHPHRRVRAVSAGVGAYVSTQERILVTNRISELEPDLVVMFSGWNDTYKGYTGVHALEDHDYLGAAGVLGEHIAQYAAPDSNTAAVEPPQWVDFRLKTHFLVAAVLYRLAPADDLKERTADRMIDPAEVCRVLAKNVRAVKDLARREGFELAFYLQPSLYNTHKTLTPHEEQLLRESERKYIAFPRYNRELYDRYRRELPKLAAQEGFFYADADRAIAREPKSVFEDQVHLGDRGNRLVAEHLATLFEQWLGDL